MGERIWLEREERKERESVCLREGVVEWKPRVVLWWRNKCAERLLKLAVGTRPPKSTIAREWLSATPV
jgi:hypothetical protein